MARLGATLAQLAKLRMMKSETAPVARGGRLEVMQAFGTNPGALVAKTYVPRSLPSGAPLVVVLHGCTQDADGYDHCAGWSQLADEYQFALLFPEQSRSNNPNRCFNWFSRADTRRGSGEALSIRQMIDAVVARQQSDPSQIFVTGLSAGGAMASSLLAAYPELFAGGAIIAGLPFSNANSVSQALAGMRGEGYPADDYLADLVRQASDHNGSWPRISIWHGDADKTVHPSNADRLIGQWTQVHGVAAKAPERDLVDGYQRSLWRDAAGTPVIEAVEISGMGHGTPLKTSGSDACGTPGPYMLEANISSTRHIARFWGIDCGTNARSVPKAVAAEMPTARLKPEPAKPEAEQEQKRAGFYTATGANVNAIIEDSLRRAGLMR